ncbi:MAG TPA: GntR family transcriptional regulator [Candidatus Baltobacteraceae bacterium]|nr:GntR family transcriptional regulator [Candidatus Baltobacteraceae bacterium]
MPAVLTIDPRSGVPIYLQIIEQIKRSVALGILVPGEQLPTVKQLALDLTVNPNTVARAYRDLEHDEVIETAPGRGSFVRANGSTQTARAAAADVAAESLLQAVREAKSIGLTASQVRALFETALARWFPEEQ